MKLPKWLRRNSGSEVELTCEKCGATPIYIACPDHCLDCYVKYELLQEGCEAENTQEKLIKIVKENGKS